MIKNIRRRRNITQKQLANMLGISQSYLSKLENDKKNYFLKLTIEDILSLSNNLAVNPVILGKHLIKQAIMLQNKKEQ